MYLFSKIWQTVRTKYLYYNGMEFWYINNSLHEYFGGKKNFKIISQDISYFPWVGLLEYFFWGGVWLNRHISRIIIMILLLHVIAENIVSAESVNVCYSLLNIVYSQV